MMHLHSPLSVDECVQKLKADVDGPFALLGSKPVIGSVNERRALLRKRLPVFTHNSFQPHLSATFTRHGSGTSVYCKFVLHPFVLIFMTFWVSAVVFIGGTAAVVTIGEILKPNPPEGAWVAIAVPPGMLAFAAALTYGGWMFSSSDKDFLLRFIERRLQTQIGESDPFVT